MGQLLFALLIIAAIVYGVVELRGTTDTPPRPESIDPQAIPNQYKRNLEEALRTGVEKHREVDRQIE